ncbi:MAG: hypothetical protein Q8O40_14120 [Chloroflexota bacterium]|nr:hypothetical protein [Chloroflexota bacterium]
MGRFRYITVILALVVVAVGLVAATGAAGGERQGPPQDLQGQALGLFEIDGVVFTDIDEQSGRLVVGVENRGLARSVQARANALGIPVSAVSVVETKPIVFATTLRDNVRPLKGGLQIWWQKKAGSGIAYVCTLGFNASRGEVAGFVTNSHCTATQGSVEGTKHYQPTGGVANLVGTETADPAFFSCARKKKCRYSDSAFSALASGVSADLGYLERTTGPNNGFLTIAGSFRISSEASGNAPVGATVNKVGRTTGWTQGTVLYSNVNVGVSGTNIIMLGQDMVAAGVGGGDSGSPVFGQPNEAGDVTLQGILWGGSTDGAMFVYSPMVNVQRSSELGDLTTTAP